LIHARGGKPIAPVILALDLYANWLNPSGNDPVQLLELFRAFPS